MQINIDSKSGFCFGVVKTITEAEKKLHTDKKLYCLGDIVHNNEEVKRLEKSGLIIITHKELQELKNCKVLLRAHGEPPSTYKIAEENNIELIDATCPIVLRLQQNIKDISEKDDETQILIYGEKGHAEVKGLYGQTKNKAIIIEKVEDLKNIKLSKKISLFSQTTKSVNGYNQVVEEINKIKDKDVDFQYKNSICKVVSNRIDPLKQFANEHDVIIFMSGKKSSNGKQLYNVCLKENTNSFFISKSSEIKTEWFTDAKKVGICGATSTPQWLMVEAKEKIDTLVHI